MHNIITITSIITIILATSCRHGMQTKQQRKHKHGDETAGQRKEHDHTNTKQKLTKNIINSDCTF